MLIQVEKHGLVMKIDVSDLLDQAHKLLVIPGERRVLDHDVDGIIVLVVSGVEISNFRPQEESLADSH